MFPCQWTCCICMKVRDDGDISVLTKPLMVDGKEVGQQNVRYCNDNDECQEGAKDFEFIKKEA